MKAKLLSAIGFAAGLSCWATTQGVTAAPRSAHVERSHIQNVGYRHHYRWGRHRHRHFGRDIGIGLGLGLLGGAIAGYSRYDGLPYDERRNQCASRFRSFEWDTGLYTTYGGEKRLCPYLR